MNWKSRNWKSAILLIGIILFSASCHSAKDSLWGCAAAPRKGQRVQIATESAVIIWDAATKTQHFIRRASFSTAAADFGFLVPTPTKPELAESSNDAFSHLERLMTRRRSGGR